MSKFLIYHAVSPLGYKIDIMSDGLPGKVTYEKLFEDEEMRIMKIEATGAKVLKEVAQVVQAPQRPLASTTAPQATFCDVHKVEMKERDGKYGKFYSHAQKNGDIWEYCTGKGWGVK
jgi:hypothetical protein